jgi:hypothetical protein
MNVDYATFKGAEEIAFKHTHKTGKGHKVHAREFQSLDKRALRGFVQLRAEFARRDVSGRELALPCPCENSGVGNIRKHHCDLSWDGARRAGVGNGYKIRARAGAQHSNPKCLVARHAVFLQARDDGTKRKGCSTGLSG